MDTKEQKETKHRTESQVIDEDVRKEGGFVCVRVCMCMCACVEIERTVERKMHLTLGVRNRMFHAASSALVLTLMMFSSLPLPLTLLT